MDLIINSAPMVQKLGIKDNSTTQGAVQAPGLPDHLPMVFIWAQKGPIGRQLTDGSNLVPLYGSDTFDLRKKYATHQTVLSGVFSDAGNAQMIERLVPADAGPKSNMLLSLEVLVTTVPVYQRDDNGIVLKDTNGAPLVVPPVSGQAVTTAGFKVRWLKTNITSGGPGVDDSVSFGQATSAAGTLTDGESTSLVYPMLEYWAGSYGAAGSNEGLRLIAPMSTDDTPPNPALLTAAEPAFQYRLQAISRATATTTPGIVNALDGSTSMDFVLEPGFIHPISGNAMYLGDIFKDTYQSIGNPLRADVYAGIPNLHIYTDNIATVQALLLAGEQTALAALEQSAGSDITSANTSADAFMFNVLTFRNSGGAQYRSVIQDTTGGGLTFGAATNLYCAGGSDGTMDDATFNTMVAQRLTAYGDPTSDVLDTALNPISVFYDSGFALETKYAACNLLARRKDTGVILSTYTEGQTLTAAQEASVGISLRSRLALFPESTYFGTPVVRGVIMARYGKMLGVNYSKKLPLTLWLAGKAAAMMGAGSGMWNASKLFDIDPGSIVNNFTDLNVSFVPASQRIVDWSTGLNYPIAYSMDRMFFPALKTVYNDDTSVLTSFFAMMGCISLQKVGEQVWREFSGAVRFTRAQLVQNVNQAVTDKTNGKYAGLLKVIPQAYISGGDDKRGYSYTLPIQMYANNSENVMTLSVEAYRMPAAK